MTLEPESFMKNQLGNVNEKLLPLSKDSIVA